MMQFKAIVTFFALTFAGTSLAAPVNYKVSLRKMISRSEYGLHRPPQVLDARAVTNVDFRCVAGSDLDLNTASNTGNRFVRQCITTTRVQAVLDAAHAAGVAIPNGLTVELTNDLHTSPQDSNKHISFRFTAPAICHGPGGVCKGHAYDPHETANYAHLGVGTIYSGGQPVFVPGQVVSKSARLYAHC